MFGRKYPYRPGEALQLLFAAVIDRTRQVTGNIFAK
jgi:hypothetical protein